MARYSTLHEERHLESITYHCISYCYSLNSVTFDHRSIFGLQWGLISAKQRIEVQFLTDGGQLQGKVALPTARSGRP